MRYLFRCVYARAAYREVKKGCWPATLAFSDAFACRLLVKGSDPLDRRTFILPVGKAETCVEVPHAESTLHSGIEGGVGYHPLLQVRDPIQPERS